MKLRRLPIESAEPVASFARMRVVLALAALGGLLAFDIEDERALVVLILAVALPWSIAMLVVSRRAPTRALSPLVAAIDLLVLAAIGIAAPEAYAAVRFVALFVIAAHAHFQGEQRGLLVAAAGVLALVPATLARGEPFDRELLAFYETLFTVSALCAGMFVGRLRTAESADRLRARELSHRLIEAENQVRRRVAESLHDGPVQELVSMDLMLDAAMRAWQRGEEERALQALEEARSLAERNIGALREEIVGLGPYALEELSYHEAVEQCAPAWDRRYAMEVELRLAPIDLSNELCGSLFGITQEAVANAGRHAEASHVLIALERVDGAVELRVSDDGTGFRDSPPLAVNEPGHIGLASMRARAELIEGELDIETGVGGSAVIVRAPLAQA